MCSSKGKQLFVLQIFVHGWKSKKATLKAIKKAQLRAKNHRF